VISEGTVKQHVKHILRKLRAGEDSAAFRADVSNGDEVAKLFDIADAVRVRKPVATEPLRGIRVGRHRSRPRS
jgi:hypothetical protein